jgi:probable F420-dependent oxidoreductase
MYYGVDLPHFGDCADVRLLADMAREAEAAGWDGFFLWDHILFSFGTTPMVDPWIALTAVALATERIRFGPMVTPLPRRRPTKLARETATLDRLSNGRLILGVGSGEDPGEFEGLGEEADSKTRGDMLDEGLDVLAKLWSGEPVQHQGKHYTVQDAQFLPTPVQQPRIPVWVAGRWPNKRPFRRAALWDGVFAIDRESGGMEPMTPEQVREMVAFIKSQRTSGEPFDVAHQGVTPGGDPTHAHEIIAPYAEAGVTWWIESILPNVFGWEWEGPWPIDKMQERIRQGPGVMRKT